MGKKQLTIGQVVTISILIGIMIGIGIGAGIQQIIFINGVVRAGESWEGVISNINIEIDFNETELVEATYNLIPLEDFRPVNNSYEDLG